MTWHNTSGESDPRGINMLRLLAIFGSVSATVYLKEDFSGDWESRWSAAPPTRRGLPRI